MLGLSDQNSRILLQPRSVFRNGRPRIGPPPIIRQFVVSAENRLVEWLMSHVDYNADHQWPVLFYGHSGCGKTSLAETFAEKIMAQSGFLSGTSREDHAELFIATSATDFHRRLTAAIQSGTTEDFRCRWEQRRLMLVDDIGHLANRPAAQAELMRLIDYANCRFIFTSRSLPAEIDGLSHQFCSRLTSGISVPVQMPDAPARMEIILSLAESMQLDIDIDAARQLAERLSSSPVEIGQSLRQILIARSDGAADHQRRPVSKIDLKHCVGDIESNDGPSVAQIIDASARGFGLKPEDLLSASRRQTIVRARGVAMCLCRKTLKLNLLEIGQSFGGRDQSTVRNALRRTAQLYSQNQQFKALYLKIEKCCRTDRQNPAVEALVV